MGEAWSMLEDQDINVLVGHPDTRAELTIWTSFEPISAAERTGGLPWVSLEVRGWLAERQQSIWDTRVRQKRVPLARKCAKNVDP